MNRCLALWELCVFVVETMLSLVLSVFTDSPIFLIGNDLSPGDKQCCSQSCFIIFFQRHLQIVLGGLKYEFINMYPTLEYKHMNTLQNLVKSSRFLLFLIHTYVYSKDIFASVVLINSESTHDYGLLFLLVLLDLSFNSWLEGSKNGVSKVQIQ